MELQLACGRVIFEINTQGIEITMADTTIQLTRDESAQLQEWTADNVEVP